MKKHIITIAGAPGSGKSSTAKIVAQKLGYEHFSSGDMFRKMAAEKGLSVEEINEAAEEQKSIDQKVDELLVGIGKEKDKVVIDSRTAFHWIPDSFKVFLDLDSQIAAERTFAQIQKEGRASQAASSVEEVRANTIRRTTSEHKRYQSLYNLDVTDKKSFDLVVDTQTNNLEQVAAIVVAAYETWVSSN
jgi:cytidylate kinase